MVEEIVKYSIKSVYKEFARNCPELCKNSIVAGGAIRDSLLGKEVKDIDIFIPWCGLSGTDKGKISYYLSTNMEFAGNAEEYPTDSEHGIVVYNFEARFPEDVLPIQVITYPDKDYASIIKKFPISLSRVFFNPMHDKIVLSESFKQGESLRKVWFKRPKINADSVYITKMYRKYQDRDYKWLPI